MAKKPELIVITLSVIILAVIFTYSTAFHAFDDDEFQHSNVAWQMHGSSRPYTDFFEHHFVLYHGLTSHFFRLGEGRSMIFVFRAFSLLSSAAAFFFLYKAGRGLGASAIGAAGGIWLLGLTPMYILKMTEARPEAPAIAAFAGALYLMFGDAGEKIPPVKKELFSRSNLKAIAFGLLLGFMTLLSQKYAVTAAAGLLAAALFKGKAFALKAALACLLSGLAYGLWLLMMGVAREAFELTFLLNLRWKYSFSPAGYASELYLTAGPLIITGVLGILYGCLRRSEEDKHSMLKWISIAVLLAGAAALIVIIPVPYRQSFLPLTTVLALGAMLFITRLLDIYPLGVAGRVGVAAAVFLFLGASSIADLPEHLAPDNRHDLAMMDEIGEFYPEGPVFDGRRLMFQRPHIGKYACMHGEILLMLNLEEYADEVISGLQEAGLPPVIRDYRVELMPEAIKIFIEQHYGPTPIDDVYGARVQVSRLMPGRTTHLEIPVSARWKADWSGDGRIYINETLVDKRDSLYWEKDSYSLQSDGFVSNFRLKRDYSHGQ